MTYSEKLRDPRWQKKRLLILDRDGWRCRSCGSETKYLHVHHVVYRRLEPWEYPDYCYQTLCDDCHQERQELTDKAVDALRLAIREIPTARLSQVCQKLMAEAMLEIGVEK